MLLFPVVILSVAGETDREFMKALFIRHRITMFRVARTLTKSDPDAEDVVSEARVLLIGKISRLRQLDCNVLEGYVISTVKNAAYLLHRRKKGRKEAASEEALQFLADENTAPDRRMLQKCTIQELMEAIWQLSEDDQLVLRMKYFEKCSDSEIAKVLGIQSVSVRSRLTRARQRIYVLLGGESYEF